MQTNKNGDNHSTSLR